MNSNIEIFTDGGCSVHSGKAGCWAFAAILNDEVIGQDFGVVEDTTNSAMEVRAMKEALDFAVAFTQLDGGEVVIKSDSQYCVNSYNTWTEGWAKKGWKKSNNKKIEHLDLWKEMHQLRHPRIKVEWVRGHDGNKWNEYVDGLCKNR